VLLDLEGVELGLQAIVGTAVVAARDCMAEDLKHGRLNLGYRIDVHDEAGAVVHTLRFSDAVQIVSGE
jgi:hypothetical protein